MSDHYRRLAALHAQIAEVYEAAAKEPEIQLAECGDSPLMGQMAPPLLSVADVAAILKVGERTVRRWRKEGRLPRGIEIAGITRWRPAEIHGWIEEGGE